MSRKSR